MVDRVRIRDVEAVDSTHVLLDHTPVAQTPAYLLRDGPSLIANVIRQDLTQRTWFLNLSMTCKIISLTPLCFLSSLGPLSVCPRPIHLDIPMRRMIEINQSWWRRRQYRWPQALTPFVRVLAAYRRVVQHDQDMLSQDCCANRSEPPPHIRDSFVPDDQAWTSAAQNIGDASLQTFVLALLGTVWKVAGVAAVASGNCDGWTGRGDE